jgi:hypothetical protein
MRLYGNVALACAEATSGLWLLIFKMIVNGLVLRSLLWASVEALVALPRPAWWGDRLVASRWGHSAGSHQARG